MVTSSASIIRMKVGYVHTTIRSASPVCSTQLNASTPLNAQMAVR